MKIFGLASAMVFAAALLMQPAAAADYYAPRHYGPRHKAEPRHQVSPHHAYHHKRHHQRSWTCNEHGNCQPNWGWGWETGNASVAAVIVARGPIPLYAHDYDPYSACQMPRRVWTGYRWLKVWDPNCAR